MDPSKQVVPWRCHICDGRFSSKDGGLCSRCNGVACRKHLRNVGKGFKIDLRNVCVKCVRSDEKDSPL